MVEGGVLTAVEPDGVCVVDSQGENGRLARSEVIHMARLTLDVTYRHTDSLPEVGTKPLKMLLALMGSHGLSNAACTTE